uniref:Uncharacterized protein n=1 Tax=Tetraselmis chuii TaxID=63592 RepID=A0A7S1SM45_9CHLO
MTISQVAPEYRRLCSVAVFLQPPKAKQRRRTALIVPTGAMPFESDLMTSLLMAHRSMDCDQHSSDINCDLEGVAAEDGLLLVQQGPYYGAIDSLVERVPDQASVARLRPYIEQLPIRFREVPVSELGFFRKYEGTCARYPLCSGTIDITLFDATKLRAMSAVCLKLCLCDNILPILHVQTMASSTMMFPSSRAVALFTDLSSLCMSVSSVQ